MYKTEAMASFKVYHWSISNVETILETYKKFALSSMSEISSKQTVKTWKKKWSYGKFFVSEAYKKKQTHSH